MKKYVLAIDLGTTSIRAIIFDKFSNVIFQEQAEFTQKFPRNGWVLHDPLEIWDTLQLVVKRLIDKYNFNLETVSSIGITNQRETTVLWNKNTGKPVYDAIVWQSRQTSSICDELILDGFEPLFRNKTGLPIDAYFSATKVKWILDNVLEARILMDEGNLLFGTIDTWVIWKLTNGMNHVTDYSNASRTLMFNIFELKWDQEILDILQINNSILPKVIDSSSNICYTHKNNFFGYEILIGGIAGDQQASLFGHTCFKPGMLKNTYGTGSFILMNTGKKAVKSNTGLLTTVAWGLNGEVSYALEGSVFVCGSAIQWLRDGLQVINNVSESENYATKIDSSNGIYVVPAFVGLGTPYWDQDVRGSIFGITRGTTKADIIRATLESICFQTKEVVDIMIKESDYDLNKMKVDGGAIKNQFLMQFQADLLQVSIDIPVVTETTALGAAYLAGLATGFWQSEEDIINKLNVRVTYFPTKNNDKFNLMYKNWKIAVKAAQMFKTDGDV